MNNENKNVFSLDKPNDQKPSLPPPEGRPLTSAQTKDDERKFDFAGALVGATVASTLGVLTGYNIGKHDAMDASRVKDSNPAVVTTVDTVPTAIDAPVVIPNTMLPNKGGPDISEPVKGGPESTMPNKGGFDTTVPQKGGDINTTPYFPTDGQSPSTSAPEIQSPRESAFRYGLDMIDAYSNHKSPMDTYQQTNATWVETDPTTGQVRTFNNPFVWMDLGRKGPIEGNDISSFSKDQLRVNGIILVVPVPPQAPGDPWLVKEMDPSLPNVEYRAPNKGGGESGLFQVVALQLQTPVDPNASVPSPNQFAGTVRQSTQDVTYSSWES